MVRAKASVDEILDVVYPPVSCECVNSRPYFSVVESGERASNFEREGVKISVSMENNFS